MKTGDLIDVLGADDTPVRPVAPRLLMRAGTALLLMGAIVLAALGIREDLAAAMLNPVTLVKWLFPLLLAAAAVPAVLRLMRPQRRALPMMWLAAAVALAAGVLFAAQFLDLPAGQRWPVMRGRSIWVCLTSITVIGLPTLAAALSVLRDAAPTPPVLCGAMTGLACGALAAVIYALHCNQDAPMFFVFWYGAAILIVTAVGGFLGGRLLRW